MTLHQLTLDRLRLEKKHAELNGLRSAKPSLSRARLGGVQPASPASPSALAERTTPETRRRQGPAPCAAPPVAGPLSLTAYQRLGAEGARPESGSHWLRRHRPNKARTLAGWGSGPCRPEPTTPPYPQHSPPVPAGDLAQFLRPCGPLYQQPAQLVLKKAGPAVCRCPVSLPRAQREGRKHTLTKSSRTEPCRGRGRNVDKTGKIW